MDKKSVCTNWRICVWMVLWMVEEGMSIIWKNIFKNFPPHALNFRLLHRNHSEHFLILRETSVASLYIPCAVCSRDFSSLTNISCSVNASYGFAFALFISNGKPFTASACVKNIRIAVVVSVPKSLNKASDFVLKSSSTLTWIVLA